MFSDVVQWLRGLAVSDVQRARLDAFVESEDRLRKELADAKDEIAKLKEQCSRQTEEYREAKQRIANYEAAVEFVEHYGVLWKRKPTGGFHPVPYCPVCKIAIAAGEDFMQFCCGRCRLSANFTGGDLDRIRAELPG